MFYEMEVVINKHDYSERFSGIDITATKKIVSDLIKKSGKSDKEIANKIRVCEQAVNKWRNERSFMNLDNLYALSGFLETSIDDLLVPRVKNDISYFIDYIDDSDMNARRTTRILKYVSMLNDLANDEYKKGENSDALKRVN